MKKKIFYNKKEVFFMFTDMIVCLILLVVFGVAGSSTWKQFKQGGCAGCSGCKSTCGKNCGEREEKQEEV